MGSTLTVDNIVGATTASTIKIPGHVIQVVNVDKLDTGSANVTLPTWADSGLTCTITPKFNNSKILVQANTALGINASIFNYMRVVRNIGGGSFSMLSEAATPGNRSAVHATVYDADNELCGCSMVMDLNDSETLNCDEISEDLSTFNPADYEE